MTRFYFWFAIYGLVLMLLVGFFVGRATASPLSLSAHQANLYGGNLAIAKACIDLNVKKPTKAVLEVEGIGGGSTTIRGFPGWWPAYRTFHLRPGHKHLCRAFFVRHLEIDTVPDRPGLPRSQWTTFDATEVQSVFASLTLGTRLYQAEAATVPDVVTFFGDGHG